jgi:hypothetical protein
MAILEFDPVSRRQLFYDQFEYCLRFRVMFASLLRCQSSADIPEAAAHRNQWRSQWQGSSVTDADVIDLMDLHDRLAHFGADHQVVIHSNTVYVYSNDIHRLSRLSELEYVSYQKGTQSTVDQPRDRIILTKPQYQYRTYFKDRYQDTEPLRKFLLTRQDCFSYTRGFDHRLRSTSRFFVQRHCFVDHNNASDALMLNLVCPGIVRETLPIQAK